jgi:hypothetical protein
MNVVKALGVALYLAAPSVLEPCRSLALLRHADGMRECLFIEAEQKWAAHGQARR